MDTNSSTPASRRDDMLKFLTYKLRTHSISEDIFMEKADKDYDSDTDSDEEIDGPSLPPTGGNQLLTAMEQWQSWYPGGVSPQGIRPQPGVPQSMQTMQPNPIQAGAAVANQAAAAAAAGDIRAPGAADAPMNAPGNMMRKQALTQFLQTLKSPQSAEPQERIPTTLKSNPQLMAAFIKQRQSGSIRARGAASPAMNAPDNMMRKQALMQLLRTLKSPQSAEQQERILTTLKSNPQLMVDFIKQRQKSVAESQRARTAAAMFKR